MGKIAKETQLAQGSVLALDESVDYTRIFSLERLKRSFERSVRPVEIGPRTLTFYRCILNEQRSIEVEHIDRPTFVIGREELQVASRNKMLVFMLRHPMD
jgi:hypothetical protein